MCPLNYDKKRTNLLAREKKQLNDHFSLACEFRLSYGDGESRVGDIRSSQKKRAVRAANSRATQKCDSTFNYVSFVVSSVLKTKSSAMFRKQQRSIL